MREIEILKRSDGAGSLSFCMGESIFLSFETLKLFRNVIFGISRFLKSAK